MFAYRLSYIVTTYNKLPYLRQVMSRLIEARQPDEEIVVCDGGSQDGTAAYLQELLATGRIQQFVSERDKGEAHGLNKGMLMAQGEILKTISDDDAFCYPAIRQAADFMLAHPEIDVLSGETWHVSLENLQQAGFYKYSLDHFRHWLAHREPVNMVGLPMLLRRSSLPLVGLFYTGMVQVDGEFTYRITSLDVNIAWYTAILCMRIENPQSNYRTMDTSASFSETDRMRYYYDKRLQHNFYHYLRYKSVFSDAVKLLLRPVKQAYDRLRAQPTVPEPGTIADTDYQPVPGQDPIAAAFAVCDAFMAQRNAQRKAEFIMREPSGPLAKVMPPSESA